MELSTRIKLYEGRETERRLFTNLPIYARLDGINFHNFCHNLKKPYDERLSNLMVEVTKWLAQKYNANCAYTQSDEISLCWFIEDYNTEMCFNGKIQKLISHLASKLSVHFNKLLPSYIPENVDKDPCFDARVFNLPNLNEVCNTMLFRELDATSNSIQMAGQAYYSHKQLYKKNSSEIQEMLFQKGINWNDYPMFFKRGTFIIKKKTLQKFDKIEDLPLNHEARKNPDLMVERTQYIECDMPPFSKVVNREKVLFYGEEPQII